jgi:hypothetical protein
MELMRGTENFSSTALGALREESIQHDGNIVVKDQPRPLVRKGRMIECYLCLQNHFMRKCLM